MEQPKAPSSPKKAEGNPPLRRGQIRNRIIWDSFKSLAALFYRPARANGAGGTSGTGTGTATPISSSAYTSEGTSDA